MARFFYLIVTLVINLFLLIGSFQIHVTVPRFKSPYIMIANGQGKRKWDDLINQIDIFPEEWKEAVEKRKEYWKSLDEKRMKGIVLSHSDASTKLKGKTDVKAYRTKVGVRENVVENLNGIDNDKSATLLSNPNL